MAIECLFEYSGSVTAIRTTQHNHHNCHHRHWQPIAHVCWIANMLGFPRCLAIFIKSLNRFYYVISFEIKKSGKKAKKKAKNQPLTNTPTHRHTHSATVESENCLE